MVRGYDSLLVVLARVAAVKVRVLVLLGHGRRRLHREAAAAAPRPAAALAARQQEKTTTTTTTSMKMHGEKQHTYVRIYTHARSNSRKTRMPSSPLPLPKQENDEIRMGREERGENSRVTRITAGNRECLRPASSYTRMHTRTLSVKQPKQGGPGQGRGGGREGGRWVCGWVERASERASERSLGDGTVRRPAQSATSRRQTSKQSAKAEVRDAVATPASVRQSSQQLLLSVCFFLSPSPIRAAAAAAAAAAVATIA